MNFLEAIKTMQEGKKVARPSLRAVKLVFGNFVFADNEQEEIYMLSMDDINATNWEVVEEKKTLSDKIYVPFGDDSDKLKVGDVKEALKKFLNGDRTNKSAKEIFGERLISN